VLLICISALLISLVEEVAEGDGADKIEVDVREVVVEVAVIEILFVW